MQLSRCCCCRCHHYPPFSTLISYNTYRLTWLWSDSRNQGERKRKKEYSPSEFDSKPKIVSSKWGATTPEIKLYVLWFHLIFCTFLLKPDLLNICQADVCCSASSRVLKSKDRALMMFLICKWGALWFSFTTAQLYKAAWRLAVLLYMCVLVCVCACVYFCVCIWITVLYNWPRASAWLTDFRFCPPLLLVQRGSLLGSRVSLTICPCRLDECVALCVCVPVCMSALSQHISPCVCCFCCRRWGEERGKEYDKY